MTKEEYKENLIRMWDSLRIMSNAYEAIEIVENWAKEHPVKTNMDKFEEVFGFRPNVFLDGEEITVCNGYYKLDDTFWNAEYMPTKEGEE